MKTESSSDSSIFNAMYGSLFTKEKQCIHLCRIIHRWCKFGENPTNTFQDTVLASPESAFQPTIFHRDLDLLTPNCEAFISVP